MSEKIDLLEEKLLSETDDNDSTGDDNDSTGDDETYGETVVMASDVSANGTLVKWYTDDGETDYTGSISTRGQFFARASEKIFATDTTVKITISGIGSNIFDDFTIGSTDWDGVSTPDYPSVYYCKQ